MGFSTAKVSFSNSWNRNQPFWVDEAGVNDYFARSHMVLTQGAAKTDVAVYQRNYSAPSNFSTPGLVIYRTNSIAASWCFEYFDTASFQPEPAAS